MANESAKELVASLVETLREQERDAATLQERMAAATAMARSSQDLVEVSVNSRGIVIEVKFHPEAIERAGGLAALGRYVTEAAQKAAQDVTRQVDQILAPMRSRVKGLPQANELFPGMPSPNAFIPEPVEPSLSPPDAPERQAAPVVDDEVYYGDVETVERTTTDPIDRAW